MDARSTHFRAHQGLALLGEKEAALRELEMLGSRLERATHLAEHQLLMQKACEWPSSYQASDSAAR